LVIFRVVRTGASRGSQRAHDQRYLKWSWNDDGSLRLEARLPAAEGGLVVKALEAFEDAPVEEDAYVQSPVAARRADALVAIARTAVAESAGASGAAERCELVVHVDAATLVSERVGERCHVAAGPALAPETARRLGCDASVVRILERDGRPLTVGRRTRTIPPAVRRALRSREAGGAARCGSGGQTGGSLRPWAVRARRLGLAWPTSTRRGAWQWISRRAGRCRPGIGWTMTWRWMRCFRRRSLR
jgi:Domain of unknown function (DUF222)